MAATDEYLEALAKQIGKATIRGARHRRMGYHLTADKDFGIAANLMEEMQRLADDGALYLYGRPGHEEPEEYSPAIAYRTRIEEARQLAAGHYWHAAEIAGSTAEALNAALKSLNYGTDLADEKARTA